MTDNNTSSVINYNNLFHLIDNKRTFYDIGSPQNVLKTAIIMNIIMLAITFALCLIPIPFLTPIVILLYIINFSVLNIKYMRDFTMAMYQSDNQQIQSSIKTYTNNTNKITDLRPQINSDLNF